MEIIDLNLKDLVEECFDHEMEYELTLAKMRDSIRQFGVLEPLVVIPIDMPEGQFCYSVISGYFTLKVVREFKHKTVPCLVLRIDFFA